MPIPKLSPEVPKYGQDSLWKAKSLPGFTHFICEIHLLKCSKIQSDFHHKIPQEAGDESSHSIENIALLCTGCHDMVHRVAVQMSSIKATSKRSPYEIALEYAQSLNPAQVHEVASNLLQLAQLVAQYRVLKADNTIAGSDGNIMIEGIPRDLFLAFKQISTEVKVGDGRAIGMAKLGMLAVLEITAKHRPELRKSADAYIQQYIIKSSGKPSKQPTNTFDDFDERRV